MKAIVQRVHGLTKISCKLEERLVHETSFTGPGLVVLLGWTQADLSDKLEVNEEWLRTRIEGLRIFPDAQGRMNLSLADHLKETKQEGGILWVPQFTLSAELESGFRPSFTAALAPDSARARFALWKQRLEKAKAPYAQHFGVFSADMDLSFTNWGPVTIPLER